MNASYDDYRRLVANVISAEQGKLYRNGQPVEDTKEVRDAFGANMTPEQCWQMMKSAQSNSKKQKLVGYQASSPTNTAGAIITLVAFCIAVWFCGGFLGLGIGPMAGVKVPIPGIAKGIENAIGTTNSDSHVKLLSSEFAKGEYDVRLVKGKIKSVSSAQLSYVSVNFNLYNSGGEQVGVALANVNNLEPEGIWSFEAHFIEDNVASYKLGEIQVIP